MNDKTSLPPAEKHGEFQEIADGVWFVPSRFPMGPAMKISRNMVVVRSGDELTLINPVRLSTAGEAALEALGTVRHMMRLGAFHGADDVYTRQRFGATFWCQADSDHYKEPAPDRILDVDTSLPVADAELFVFDGPKKPECAVLIKRGSGILCTCDAIQHYGTYERQSLLAKIVMRFFGYSRGPVIGPFWLKFLTPEGRSLKSEIERLGELPFDIILSAHGTPLLSGGRAAVREAVRKAFPDDSSG